MANHKSKVLDPIEAAKIAAENQAPAPPEPATFDAEPAEEPKAATPGEAAGLRAAKKPEPGTLPEEKPAVSPAPVYRLLETVRARISGVRYTFKEGRLFDSRYYKPEDIESLHEQGAKLELVNPEA